MLFIRIMLVYFLFYFALDFSVVIYTDVFCLHALYLGHSHIDFLFHLLFCIMYSAFNQLSFFILCSHYFCL